MKLNRWQTIRVGFAFLAISAFWQMYNNIIPLVLTNTFHMNETYSGVIMAMDNVLALFLLPMFGGLSDRCTSPMGRRKPFILYGTIVSVVLMILIPVLDNRYAAAPSRSTETLFIIILMLLLVAMGTYRSPAVALMPDVTPKPLRSKGNAIINLMGATGAILYLLVAAVLYSASRTEGLSHVNYLPIFLIVGAVMIASMLVVIFTVDEVGLSRAVVEHEKNHPEENYEDPSGTPGGTGRLPKPVRRSLVFLLASVALWYISYNSVETWFTTYANRMWEMSLGSASLCLSIGMVGAICTYIPAGIMAEKIGRKKTILGGVALMIAAFAIMFILSLRIDHFTPVLYVLFIMVGIGWAAINVNSFPMVVEMCSNSDIGKFTGYYYTFSMAAQIVTPVVAGWFLNHVGYRSLFPYAAIAAILAFVTMSAVHHGDTSFKAERGLDAFADVE